MFVADVCNAWKLFDRKKIGPHCAKFQKKKILEQIQSYEDAPFRAQNGPFAPNKFFLEKIVNTVFVYILAHFIVKILKSRS